jgi:hypothetical protein
MVPILRAVEAVAGPEGNALAELLGQPLAVCRRAVDRVAVGIDDDQAVLHRVPAHLVKVR